MISIHQLDGELANVILAAVESGKWSYGWHSNRDVGYPHWNYSVVKTHEKNVTPISIPSPYKHAWDMMKHALPHHAYPIRCYANLHTFGTEGYPHTDSVRNTETTLVLYLNKEWKREWGGETTIFNGDDIEDAVMPKFGRWIQFPSNMVHCARSVSRICPVQRVTFVIKARHPDGDSAKLESFLTEIGADDSKHKQGSLRDHLIRVYELLRTKTNNKNVAIAGGLHSVYGTRGYQAIGLMGKNQIIKEFIAKEYGAPVENLVTRFSKCDLRGRSGETELDLMKAANLLDQGLLKESPVLKEFWEGYRG